MKFCKLCSNMLYSFEETEVDGKKVAINSCRKCEYTEPIESLVYSRKLNIDRTEKIALNKYLKYDQTLMHLDTLACPNAECPTKSSSIKKDIVAVKIDESNLIWMYQCCNCDYVWKASSQAV